MTDSLAEEILRGQFTKGCYVHVDRGKEDSLSFEIKAEEGEKIKRS